MRVRDEGLRHEGPALRPHGETRGSLGHDALEREARRGLRWSATTGSSPPGLSVTTAPGTGSFPSRTTPRSVRPGRREMSSGRVSITEPPRRRRSRCRRGALLPASPEDEGPIASCRISSQHDGSPRASSRVTRPSASVAPERSAEVNGSSSTARSCPGGRRRDGADFERRVPDVERRVHARARDGLVACLRRAPRGRAGRCARGAGCAARRPDARGRRRRCRRADPWGSRGRRWRGLPGSRGSRSVPRRRSGRRPAARTRRGRPSRPRRARTRRAARCRGARRRAARSRAKDEHGEGRLRALRRDHHAVRRAPTTGQRGPHGGEARRHALEAEAPAVVGLEMAEGGRGIGREGPRVAVDREHGLGVERDRDVDVLQRFAGLVEHDPVDDAPGPQERRRRARASPRPSPRRRSRSTAGCAAGWTRTR